MACIHGFAPSDCLICSTLQSGDHKAATATRPVEAPLSIDTPPPRPVSRRADSLPTGPRRTHGKTFTHVLVILALIVVAVIASDLFFSIVRGLFHVLELAIVAVIAAVIGYGVGRAHGRGPKED